MTAISEAVISTVNGVGRILYLRPFNEHVGTSVTDGPNIQDIVRGSRAFRTTSSEIYGKVEADFAEAEVKTAIHAVQQYMTWIVRESNRVYTAMLSYVYVDGDKRVQRCASCGRLSLFHLRVTLHCGKPNALLCLTLCVYVVECASRGNTAVRAS